MKVCIVAGDAVGGLRKHVHDTLFALDPDIQVLYIHSGVADGAAERDFPRLDRFLLGRVPLQIRKNPAISDLRNIWAVFQECRRLDIDLIHGHGAKGGLYARAVGVLMRCPSIFTPHGGSVHARFGRLKQNLFAAVEFALKFVTALFVFESNYTKEAFIEMAGRIPAERALVNFNGVKVSEFPPAGPWRVAEGTAVQLLTVGMLNSVKGQEVAVRALAALLRKGRNVALNICGTGEDHDRLCRLAEELNISSRIAFHGDVADVQAHYRMSNIVVIPSYFESFGYVGVEAGLMARPVVASNTGGLKEVVRDEETGLLFPVGDVEALACSIEYLLDNPDATDQRVANARAWCLKEFDLACMTKRLFDAYREILLKKQKK